MGNYDENDYNVDDDITTDDIDDDHNDYKDNDDGAVRRDLRCWRWPRSIIHMLQNKLCFHNQIKQKLFSHLTLRWYFRKKNYPRKGAACRKI